MIGKNEASNEEMRQAESSQRNGGGWLDKYSNPMQDVLNVAKAYEKLAAEAHQSRQKIDDIYTRSNVEPTNGYRSRLEALWVAEFEDCPALVCVECTRVPLWILGPYGKFLSDYNPDLTFESEGGNRIFVELKPNHELAMADDRQKRALELNPKYKFVVIGGYPYQSRGVTIRMLTGKQEVVHKNIQVSEVLKFLGCF